MRSSHLHLGFQIDWAANIRKSWDFTEEGAHVRLEAFLHDGEAAYKGSDWITPLGKKYSPSHVSSLSGML